MISPITQHHAFLSRYPSLCMFLQIHITSKAKQVPSSVLCSLTWLNSLTNLLQNFITPDLFTPNALLANIPNFFASLSISFNKKIHIILFHETLKTLIHLFHSYLISLHINSMKKIILYLNQHHYKLTSLLLISTYKYLFYLFVVSLNGPVNNQGTQKTWHFHLRMIISGFWWEYFSSL